MSSTAKLMGVFFVLFVVGVAIIYLGATQLSAQCPVGEPCDSFLLGLGSIMLGVLLIFPFAYLSERRFKLPGRPTMTGSFLIGLAAAIFLAIPVATYSGDVWDSYFATTFFLAALFYGLWYWWNGTKSKCPSCRKWYARSLVDRELLQSRDSWETVYDTVYTNTTTATYDGNGQRHEALSTSSTTVPRTALVTYQKYLNSFCCIFCEYKWSTTSSSRYVH